MTAQERIARAKVIVESSPWQRREQEIREAMVFGLFSPQGPVKYTDLLAELRDLKNARGPVERHWAVQHIRDFGPVTRERVLETPFTTFVTRTQLAPIPNGGLYRFASFDEALLELDRRHRLFQSLIAKGQGMYRSDISVSEINIEPDIAASYDELVCGKFESTWRLWRNE